jgi:peptidyl-prolyl cis-trans isomerase SurA
LKVEKLKVEKLKTRYLLVLSLLISLVAGAGEVDGIAARVGSAVILKSDIANEMRRSGAGAEKYADIRDEMIERELILRAAKEAKLQMQDWVVENRIRDIISRAFNGDRNKLMEALAKDKVSYPEWRQRIKDDMVVNAMRWQIVDKNIQASPAAMRDEYAAHPERYVAEKRVTVSAILLKPGDAEKSDEIDEALKNGTSFADLARKHSVDAKAKDGGQWKDVRPEDVFRPEICEEIAKMPKGTISKWIELDGWKFLLRKDDETAGGKMSFADAYDTIAANVRNDEAKRLYVDWIERLKAATYIKVYEDR